MGISDDERMGEKGEEDSHSNSKKVKSHRVMNQVLDKMERLDQVYTQMSLNLNSNISSTQMQLRRKETHQIRRLSLFVKQIDTPQSNHSGIKFGQSNTPK